MLAPSSCRLERPTIHLDATRLGERKSNRRRRKVPGADPLRVPSEIGAGENLADLKRVEAGPSVVGASGTAVRDETVRPPRLRDSIVLERSARNFPPNWKKALPKTATGGTELRATAIAMARGLMDRPPDPMVLSVVVGLRGKAAILFPGHREAELDFRAGPADKPVVFRVRRVVPVDSAGRVARVARVDSVAMAEPPDFPVAQAEVLVCHRVDGGISPCRLATRHLPNSNKKTRSSGRRVSN